MKTRRIFIKELGVSSIAVSLFPRVLSAQTSHNEKVRLGNVKYDMLIYGATPAGIACAVTAARNGLNVLLVNYFKKAGGLLTNGLGVWDTLYEGKRSPVYDELRQSVFEYYKSKYGLESAQYKASLPGKRHSNGSSEPKVIEHLIENLIENEQNINLITGFYPISSVIKNNLVQSVNFKSSNGDKYLDLQAKMWIDCTYEGDLLPILNLPYKLGRESRSEYNEPHAGRIFLRRCNEFEYDKGLDLQQFGPNFSIIYPESTGEGDNNIQAFNMRMTLTYDPDNRIEITKPHDYDRDYVKNLQFGSSVSMPNSKISWNRPQLIGLHQKYIEGDWSTRMDVIEKHKKAAISLLYYLQNDSAVPKDIQERWKKFGLPKDEFTENEHMPYEIYVREGRRLIGESVMTQYDLMPGGINQTRTPIKYDSIAITDWYLDSHACTNEKTRDSIDEGKMALFYDTYPGQVPFSSLYNKKIRNFMAPVCLSCTHVAWGSIRLEPTWMNIAESAAVAAKMCIREKKWVDSLDIDKLQIELAEKRIMIGFFNNFDIQADSPLVPALQYFSTKGFFGDYDVRSDELIDETTARSWVKNCSSILDKTHQIETSKASFKLPESGISTSEFNLILRQAGINKNFVKETMNLRRGMVLLFLYKLIKQGLRY